MMTVEQLAPRATGAVRNYRHVACAVIGKSRWYGVNSHRTHTVSQRIFDGCRVSALHAEQACVLKIPAQIRHQATLYVARISRDGSEFRSSRPCDMCQSFLLGAGIETVWYTNDGGEWEKL